MSASRLKSSYSGDPSKFPKDAVRFWMTDVGPIFLFNDKEIIFVLTATPNTKLAAAEMLELRAVTLASQADFEVGEVSKMFSKTSTSMLEVAARLRQDAVRFVLPFFGGLTKTGVRNLDSDPDATQPQFKDGFLDDPTAVQLNNDLTRLFSLGGFSG